MDIGSFAGKVADFFAGGTVKTIVDTVKDYFPPSMSEKEKAELSMAINNADHQRQIELMKLANESDAEFNARTRDMEGTAGDLKTIPILGSIIIFLRGCQRPIWGFFTLYMDYKVYTKTWVVEKDSLQEVSFIAINILVLFFLFGERAMQNVLPIVMRFFGFKEKV